MISFVKVSPGKGGRFIHLPTGLSQYGFEMLSRSGRLFDSVTGTNATCSINGIRYGIVDGVVTQFAVNQPSVEDKGLRGCPAFTQLAKYTEDLTNAAWGRANILTPILSGTFRGSNVWFLPESTASGFHTALYQSTALSGLEDNSIVGFSFIFKSTNRKIYARIINKNNIYLTTRINNETGVVESASSGLSVNVQSLTEGFFGVFISASIGIGTATATGRIDICANDQQSYTGDGVSGVYLCQSTYINFGVNGVPFIPPYVPNNSGSSISVVSEAGTSTTGTSFDLDNALLERLKTALRGPNAQGHVELTFKSNVDSGWLPNTSYVNIFSCNNNILHGLYYYKNSLGVSLFLIRTPTEELNFERPSLSVNQIFKISLDWGTHSTGQKMRITVNGVKSALANFSGSFGTQDLIFFFGNPVHAGWIKDLKYYDRPRW